LDADERRFLDEVGAFREYLGEKLFWARSSARVGTETVKALPEAFAWLLGPSRWREFFEILALAVKQYPIRSILVVAVTGLLILKRRKCRAVIAESRLATQRISTHHYGHTARALLATILLALPVPLLMCFLGWGMGRVPEISDWMRGLTRELVISGQVLFGLNFLAGVCRPKGLGVAHFGWREAPLKRFRRGIHLFALVFIPCSLVLGCARFESSSLYLDSVGRLSFMAVFIWAALLLGKICRLRDGAFTSLMEAKPDLAISRLRHVWYPVLVGAPVGLVLLAAAGYMPASLTLGIGYLATLAMISGGAVLYGLTLRWFLIRERRLALAEALKERQARRETEKATRSVEEGRDDGEESILVEDEAEALDLKAVGAQTRRLLRFLWLAGASVGLWYFWSSSIPALTVLESVTVPFLGDLTLLGFLKAGLIVVVVWIIAKNLPGLLEIAVLRATGIDVGTRNAITTLCQYGVIAVGLFLLADALKIDWSKFGWIAAALSVGLGFGLQEVVANFVCGIIVLFERPIRVGDTVTVDEVTGTVTKIRMRATTITNWDRKEYVVPNKHFITGTLMNWTLTNPITRIVLNVGVAYGSDTKRARDVLVEVANDHPLVLGEPAPMATFELFGGSSLDLTLRCYIPDMDNRVRTITELHEDIDRRFKAAGIEIAFPQLDVHVKGEAPGAP
jgi:potassium efflux system protein